MSACERSFSHGPPPHCFHVSLTCTRLKLSPQLRRRSTNRDKSSSASPRSPAGSSPRRRTVPRRGRGRRSAARSRAPKKNTARTGGKVHVRTCSSCVEMLVLVITKTNIHANAVQHTHTQCESEREQTHRRSARELNYSHLKKKNLQPKSLPCRS